MDLVVGPMTTIDTVTFADTKKYSSHNARVFGKANRGFNISMRKSRIWSEILGIQYNTTT